MTEINIGDMCTGCGRDTGPGSGLFVNRIPSGAEWDVGGGFFTESFAVNVNGWMCADCQAIPCVSCGEHVLEYETVNIHDRHVWSCIPCIDIHEFEVVA